MKKIILLTLLIGFTSIFAQAAKDPRQAVFQVTTYQKDGTVLHTGNGFLVGSNGTGVAPYSLFRDAYRAEITDSKGKKHAVGRILGANSASDVVKFTIDDAKSMAPLSVATQMPSSGARVYYPTAGKSGAATTATTVSKASPYNDYQYYELAAPNRAELFGLPLLNANGDVVAIIQENVARNASSACALDARFVQSLTISSVSALNDELNHIHIAKALPETEADATAFLYFLNPSDSLVTATMLHDYVARYPNNAEGYMNRASFFAQHTDYARANDDYATALSIAEKNTAGVRPEDVHYQLSRTMFNTVNVQRPTSYWSLDRAAEEAAAAYRINPNPVYLNQQARCLYAQNKFSDAYRLYMQVNQSPIASAETYFDAAQALDATHTDSAGVLTLLDSCVVRLEKPYSVGAAQYVFARAQYEMKMGKYRAAVNDLNEYEKALGPSNLSAQFYYLRMQCEKAARMYQQALSDIMYAQTIASRNQAFEYGIEEALLLMQVGMYEDVIAKARQLVDQRPDDADCHKILGIAYGETKQRAKALDHLNKARALGDTTADTYIKRYNK
ncbi:MAG: hypothetical protein IJ553_00965 [Alloprevotella sp.]|nr:hypothetical protein [Alloprevotella sp.]